MFRLSLSGDPVGGWMGEIHDGDKLETFTPEGGDLKEALGNMLRLHFVGDQPAAMNSDGPTATGQQTAAGQAKLSDQAAAIARVQAAADAAKAKSPA